MKVLKIIGGIVGLIAVSFVGVGFMLPDAVHMERTVEIDAPVCNVHAIVHQMGRFNEYSAWATKDAAAKYTYEGPASGVGAKMSWVGDEKSVGKGSMVITKDVPCSSVETDLDFGVDVAKANWELSDAGGKTLVKYGFDGDAKGSLVGRYFNLMMDRFLGADYEQTLTGLKRVAEAGPKVDIAGVVVQVNEATPVPYAYVELSTSKDPDAIGAALGPAFGQVMGALGAAGLEPAGAVIVVTTAESADGYSLLAGVPVSALPATPFADSAVKTAETASGRVAKFEYKGAYSGLGEAHAKLVAWLAIHKLEVAGPTWEEFVNDPGNTPEAELLTHIYYPVK